MYDIKIPGWISENELKHIELLSSMIPENGNVLEVGSFCGRSSFAWANSIPTSATLYCVDPWEGVIIPNEYQQIGNLGWSMSKQQKFTTIPDDMIFIGTLNDFLHNTSDCKNIITKQGYSAEILPTFTDTKFDLIFLDGDHTNPIFKSDLRLSYPLIKQGGILCGHDFIIEFGNVIMETKKFCAEHNLNLSFYPNSSIWVIKFP
jgi:predicted O-methyltransferase YrrM